MKRKLIFIVLLALLSAGLFAQNAALPRLAVVQFTTNTSTEKIRMDSITVRNLVESKMVETRKYEIITRDDIDKLMENQKIQVSSISSAENLKKLQLQNISYIVTGSLDAMDNDYAITVRVLDVSTGKFSHTADEFTGSGSRDLYTGITGLMKKFNEGMSADEKGAIVQGQGGRGSSSAGASDYYGTWIQYESGNTTRTLIIEANRITYRFKDNSSDQYIVISNCTWTAENNSAVKTLADYPRGYRISGGVTENKGYYPNTVMPFYLFIHKSENNKIHFYGTPDSSSQMQNSASWSSDIPFTKVQ